uniref:Uncharacterized protein n=1 Tax=Cannabis sativa TaxID=3483 RepID=A0A803NUW1_CANSA
MPARRLCVLVSVGLMGDFLLVVGVLLGFGTGNNLLTQWNSMSEGFVMPSWTRFTERLLECPFGCIPDAHPESNYSFLFGQVTLPNLERSGLGCNYLVPQVGQCETHPSVHILGTLS